MASTAGRQQAHTHASMSYATPQPPPSVSQPQSQAQSASQPEVSLLGTLSLSGVTALLHHITGRAGVGLPVAVMPGTTLCERETILQRVDDETSSMRETGDNAWASVVKARRGVCLHVVESLLESSHLDARQGSSVECKLVLPLPALPERQYPRVTVRPTCTVQMLSSSVRQPASITSQRQAPLSSASTSFPAALLPFDPDEYLDTDSANGWKSFVSAIGWSTSPLSDKRTPRFLRYGLSFPLNHVFSRAPSASSPSTQLTRYTLSVYRIFVPPAPHSVDAGWTPIDPLGATVVVHLTATIGGQLDQTHFNPYTSPQTATSTSNTGSQNGGLDPTSTVENAIEVVEAIARNLRGFVDLRRLNTD